MFSTLRSNEIVSLSPLVDITYNMLDLLMHMCELVDLVS